MNETLIQDIQTKKHIEIVVEQEKFLFSASLLYSYLLTLHKKVSFFYGEKVDYKFTFLPWIDKIKTTPTPSAELSIVVDFSAKELFEYLESLDIKINKKMATALCAELIYKSKNFLSDEVDGITFALLSKSIELGAEYKTCKDCLLLHKPLSYLRLKAKMLDSMVLKKDATIAEFVINDELLTQTGATVWMAHEIAQEAYALPYVKEIKIIKEYN